MGEGGKDRGVPEAEPRIVYKEGDVFPVGEAPKLVKPVGKTQLLYWSHFEGRRGVPFAVIVVEQHKLPQPVLTCLVMPHLPLVSIPPY